MKAGGGAVLFTVITSAVAVAQTPAPVLVAPLPRIMEFRAHPSITTSGNMVTLIWATENPGSVTIDPEPGRVVSRGSMQVRPHATTTYTITVTGSSRTLSKQLTVTVSGAARDAAPAPKPKTESKAVPRAPDGKPDLSGVYWFRVSDALGNGRDLGSFASGPELQPGMEHYRVVRAPNDLGAYSDCRPIVGPPAFTVPYPFQIIQSRDYVVILHEFPGAFRIVPIRDTAHSPNLEPAWLGNSVGRWDGDILVIETIGFNTQAQLSGFRHSESLRIVERFSRPEANTLQYEATLEDPEVFVRPWIVRNSFPLRPELRKIDEFVCENNKDYRRLLEKR